MVWKIKIMVISMLTIVCAIGATASAYSPYDGTMSNTYVQYFKDILVDKKLTENYVAFRSGQYEYIMVVGELEKNQDSIELVGSGVMYKFTSSSSYNANYSYSYGNIDEFTLDLTDDIVYTDLGDYPQLIERSARIEELTLIILGVFGLYTVLRRIFSCAS